MRKELAGKLSVVLTNKKYLRTSSVSALLDEPSVVAASAGRTDALASDIDTLAQVSKLYQCTQGLKQDGQPGRSTLAKLYADDAQWTERLSKLPEDQRQIRYVLCPQTAKVIIHNPGLLKVLDSSFIYADCHPGEPDPPKKLYEYETLGLELFDVHGPHSGKPLRLSFLALPGETHTIKLTKTGQLKEHLVTQLGYATPQPILHDEDSRSLFRFVTADERGFVRLVGSEPARLEFYMMPTGGEPPKSGGHPITGGRRQDRADSYAVKSGLRRITSHSGANAHVDGDQLTLICGQELRQSRLPDSGKKRMVCEAYEMGSCHKRTRITYDDCCAQWKVQASTVIPEYKLNIASLARNVQPHLAKKLRSNANDSTANACWNACPGQGRGHHHVAFNNCSSTKTPSPNKPASSTPIDESDQTAAPRQLSDRQRRKDLVAKTIRGIPDKPATSTQIPVGFHGEWAEAPEKCGKLDDMRLSVSAGGLSFWETSVDVRSVTIISSRKITVVGLAEGEGETWNTNLTFELSADGKSLFHADTKASRVRCNGSATP